MHRRFWCCARTAVVRAGYGNNSSRTAQWGPSFTSTALPSIPRGTGPGSTRKLAASSRPSDAFEATFGANSFAYFGSEGARKHRQRGRSQCTSPAVARVIAFHYTLEYSKGSANGNTDFLSRLPEPATEHDHRGGLAASPPWMMGVSSSSGPAGFALVPHRPWCWLGWAGAPPRERGFGWAPFRLFGLVRFSCARATYED